MDQLCEAIERKANLLPQKYFFHDRQTQFEIAGWKSRANSTYYIHSQKKLRRYSLIGIISAFNNNNFIIFINTRNVVVEINL